MTRFGAAMLRIDERHPGSRLPLLSVSQTRGILRQSELSDRPPRADSLDVYKVCHRGDVVFNKMSIRSGAMGVSPEDGLVTYHYEVMRPIGGTDPRYIVYLMKSSQFTAELIRRERGIGAGGNSGVRTTEVPFSLLRTIDAFIPGPESQSAIANYLDTHTAKIDALIGKQERLIEMLAERRQAVISHAVTKGLDPNVTMKDSSQAWLGEVPAAWQVSHLKRKWRVIDCKHVTAEFVDEGIPLASIRESQSKWVDLGVAKQTTEAFYEQLIEGNRKPRARDLIFTRNATVGAVAQVPPNADRFAVGQDVCILRALSVASSSDYQQYLLQSWVVSSQIESLLLGSTFKRINVEQIRDFVLPVPGDIEQREIALYLDRETAQVDVLSAKAREMIDVLKERRQSLISAAVTGKIDVRGLV